MSLAQAAVKRLVTYKITVHTGKQKDAGSDAHVFVTLLSEKGKSRRVQLKNDLHKCFIPGREQSFTFEKMEDIGDLTSLIIQHDDSGASALKSPAWYLEKVVVDNSWTHQQWTFVCQNWLASDRGDRLIRRTLFPKFAQQSEIPYKITIYTQEAGTGTNASCVTVRLHGDKGSGPPCVLRCSSSNRFIRGDRSEFTIQHADIGEITCVELSSFASDIGADQWVVAGVQVVNQRNKSKVVCPAENRAAPVDASNSYRLFLKPKFGAYMRIGVDALSRDLFCYLCCKPYSTASLPIHLSGCGARRKEEQQCIPDIYRTSEPAPPTLPMPTNASTLAEIEKYNTQATRISKTSLAKCECGRYFTPSALVVHFRACQAHMDYVESQKPPWNPREINVEKRDAAIYRVTVVTGSQPDAGTDAGVYLRLYGPNRAGETVILARYPVHWHDLYESGHTDVFEFPHEDLGDLRKIKVWHDNKGRNPAWFLEHITVEVNSPTRFNATYHFPCHQWFDRWNGDELICRYLLEQRLVPARPPTPVISEAEMTKAALSLAMGAKVPSLKPPTTDYGRIGMFVPPSPPPRTAGGAPGHAIVRPGSARAHTPGSSRPPSAHSLRSARGAAASPMHSRRGASSGGGGAFHSARATIADRPMTATGKLRPPLNKTQPNHHAINQAPKTQVEYLVQVFTGSLPGSGTDSEVFVRLSGSATGPSIKLSTFKLWAVDLFERGQRDEFVFSSSDLGPLKTCSVWHNNKGKDPGWYLEKIVVKNKSDNKQYVFPCKRWLAEDQDDRAVRRTLTCA